MKGHPPDNFGGLSRRYSSYSNSRVVILPVPFDRTSTWIRGSARGPQAIIRASQNMELYDIETDWEVYRAGIHTAGSIRARNPSEMVTKVRRKARSMLKDGKFVAVIGGEHTVALGSIQAHQEAFPDMSVLHLDAHLDSRDTYEGEKYSHACVIARTRDMVKNIVSVGIRSMDSAEIQEMDRRKTFFASRIRASENWTGNVVQKLSRKVYVTLDVDVFDPSIMPSTGTPEPGGLGWYEVMDLLEKVVQKKTVVGFDVVELCPARLNQAPDFLAAKLIYKMLSLIFRSR